MFTYLPKSITTSLQLLNASCPFASAAVRNIIAWITDGTTSCPRTKRDITKTDKEATVCQ